MRAAAEIVAFGGLALGLHLAVFAVAPGGAPGASGAGGEATVTLRAADGALGRLVARWDAPPPPPAPPAQIAPPPADQSAARPQATLTTELPAAAPPAPAALRPAPARGVAPAPASAPPPPPAAAPRSTPRPAARPERPDRAERRVAEPPRPAAAAPSDRAAGLGGGATAGQAARAETPARDPAQQRHLMAQWGGGIRAAIERRLRPAGGATGTVRVRLSVATDGRLAGARLVASSGHPGLDRAALAAIRAARYPSAPPGITPGAHAFTLPLTQR